MTVARAHALPITRSEINAALAERYSEDERPKLFALSKRLAALLHYELHEKLEALKESYRLIDPDRDHREKTDEAVQDACGQTVREVLSEVLAQGNYRALGQEELDFALKERSLFPIAVSIDFGVFDDFVVFSRGESVRDGEVTQWFGLKKKTIAVPTYDRVCLFLRFKPESALDQKQRKRFRGEPGQTVLKLFRNIPKADLEMLFPNTRLEMRTIDKLLIGVPALVGGVPVLAKLAPAAFALMVVFGLSRGEIDKAAIIAGLSGVVGLGLFLFRQWDKFKSRKVLFMKMLSENLYFRNIDNNEGVITRLIDEAEEEEHKEAMIAYTFLLEEPDLSEEALDERAEAWLRERFDVDVDFEVDDALQKLERLRLVERGASGYRAVDLDEASRTLEARWDSLFRPRNRPPELDAVG